MRMVSPGRGKADSDREIAEPKTCYLPNTKPIAGMPGHLGGLFQKHKSADMNEIEFESVQFVDNVPAIGLMAVEDGLKLVVSEV